MAKKIFSIKWEIMIFTVILSGAALGGLSYFSLDYQKKSLTRELELRGKGIAENMASSAADFMLRKDALEVARLVRKTMDNDGVRYVFITDEKREIAAHNDMSMRKKKYSEPAGERTENGNLIHVSASGEKVIDFASPVAAGGGKINLGRAHVGISYSVIDEVVGSAFKNLMIITAAALLVSILGAFFLGSAFAKPIKLLARGAQRAGTGDLDFRINVKSANETAVLADAFNKMTADLRKAQEVLIGKKTMERELEIAKEIQLSIIPKGIPEMAGYRAAAYYKSAKEVGGDYYDFVPLGFGKMGLVMADVSGKGVPAAMVMSMTSVLLHAQSSVTDNVRETLVKINDELKKTTTRGLFVTMFYGLLNTQEHTLDFVSAGHNETFVYRQEKNDVEQYVPGGFPLMMGPTSVFAAQLREARIELKTGDKVVLYTDGINEAMNEKGAEFGILKFRNMIKDNGKKSAQEMLDAVLKGVAEFVGKAEQSDDVAMMVIEKIY